MMNLNGVIASLKSTTVPSIMLDRDIAMWLGWEMTELPRWTGSLDAALQLLPDGAYWLVGAGRTRPDEPLYGAQVFRPAPQFRIGSDDELIGEGESNASAAIAICIAGLRARSAMGAD